MPSVVAVRASTASLFGILGQIFPVWLKFRGGKGVATALAAFSIIAPKAVLLAAGIFIIVMLIFRYVSVASIMAGMLFPSFASQRCQYGAPPLQPPWTSFSSPFIFATTPQNMRRHLPAPA